MRDSARWVSWEPAQRNGKVTKRPVQTNGRAASSTDPHTWADYASVERLPRKGWVLGDGIGCIDLDNCFDGGVLAGWAREIISGYSERAVLVEVSPSWNGVHIFLPMPQGKGRKIRDGRSIEIYPPESGRYICVTGRVLKGV